MCVPTFASVPLALDIDFPVNSACSQEIVYCLMLIIFVLFYLQEDEDDDR